MHTTEFNRKILKIYPSIFWIYSKYHKKIDLYSDVSTSKHWMMPACANHTEWYNAVLVHIFNNSETKQKHINPKHVNYFGIVLFRDLPINMDQSIHCTYFNRYYQNNIFVTLRSAINFFLFLQRLITATVFFYNTDKHFHRMLIRQIIQTRRFAAVISCRAEKGSKGIIDVIK